MAKIERLPSGSYRTRIYDKNTKKAKSITASTKQEVRLLAAEYLYTKNRPASEMTVAEAVESYIINRSSVLSPSTVRGYRKIQKNHFKKISNVAISLLSSEDIQKMVNYWSIDHSPKTVRNIYGLLVSSIRAALPGIVIDCTLPQKEILERHIPTDEDIRKLLDASDDYLRISILLASIGTMRRGEIAALNYEDIEGNVIHVSKSMVQDENGKYCIRKVPKTSTSDRFIEYPEKVIDEIGAGTGRIVTVNPDAITGAFINLRNSLGLKCRFHDLRHYAASIMHAIGIPDQYIMEVGGWSTDGVLKSVYRNVLDDKSREFSDKRNAYMEKFI